jgi:hypothetical protein
MPAGIHSYRLNELSVQQVVLRQGHFTPLSVLFGSILVLTIGYSGAASVAMLAVVLSLFVLLFFKSFRNYREMLAGWRSFEVAIDRGRLRWVHGSHSVEVDRSAISRISEIAGRGIAIESADNRRMLWIPSLVGGYADLKDKLMAWAPIERRGSIALWAYGGFPAALALYISAIVVRSPYVFFPVAGIAGFYLMRLCRAVIENRPGGRLKGRVRRDPPYVGILPFALLLLLVLKSFWFL